MVDTHQAALESLPGEALFKEARQRRRKRWMVGVAISVVVVAASLLPLAVSSHDGQPVPRQGHRSKPSSNSPAPTSHSSLTGTILNGPGALAIAPDGGVLVDEQGSNRIVERQPDGRFVVIAGTGRQGFSGDGGPAGSARLDQPVALAVSAGGTVYVADLGNNRIRSISPAGTITTVAKAEQPLAVAVGPGGTVFVVDEAGVQTLGAHGALNTVIPVASGPARDPTIDGSQMAVDPDAIAVSGSGDIYVANASPKVVILYPPSGPPTLVGSSGPESGIYVTRAGLASGPNGTIVVGDYGAFAIDAVVGSNVRLVASFGLRSIPGLDGFRPSGVAVAADGEIYAATDGENGGTNVPALVAIDPDGRVHLLDRGAPVPQPAGTR